MNTVGFITWYGFVQSVYTGSTSEQTITLQRDCEFLEVASRKYVIRQTIAFSAILFSQMLEKRRVSVLYLSLGVFRQFFHHNFTFSEKPFSRWIGRNDYMVNQGLKFVGNFV